MRTPWIRGLAAAALLALSGLAGAQAPAAEKPKEPWNPNAVYEELFPFVPSVPDAQCEACQQVRSDALEQRSFVFAYLNELRRWRYAQEYLETRIAGGRTGELPYMLRGADPKESELPKALENAKQQVARYEGTSLYMLESLRRMIDELAACNNACGELQARLLLSIRTQGANPFDPSNPLGRTNEFLAGPGATEIAFSAPAYTGNEGDQLTVTVQRLGSSEGQVAVDYATLPGGTATPGADFPAAQGRLNWPDGDGGPRTLTFALVDDNIPEGSEYFEIVLSGVVGKATIRAPNIARVTINDKGTPPPAGLVQFTASSYLVAEGPAPALVSVGRSGGSEGTITVRYRTSGVSALSGVDFTPVDGVLTWASGDTSAKTISIGIVDDTQSEPDETFRVQLEGATLNGAPSAVVLGSLSSATVTIIDNDASTPVGPCGPQGHAWQPNTGAAYTCAGTCIPPTPQVVTVSGTTMTITPFHADGAATFEGCTTSLNSNSTTLRYFNQPIHRATVTRTSNNAFSAAVTASTGQTCQFTCNRSGP